MVLDERWGGIEGPAHDLKGSVLCWHDGRAVNHLTEMKGRYDTSQYTVMTSNCETKMRKWSDVRVEGNFGP